MACIATVRPMPARIRSASRSMWTALPRITPPLSQYRNRTSRTPAARQATTTSSEVIDSTRGRVFRDLPLGQILRDELLVRLAASGRLRDEVDHDPTDHGDRREGD